MDEGRRTKKDSLLEVQRLWRQLEKAKEGLRKHGTICVEGMVPGSEMGIGGEPFRLLTESIPVLVWSARPDGISDYYNPRFLEYLGKTPEEMLGWTWASTLHPDDQQRSIDAWTEAVNKGTEYCIEYRICRADGQYRWHIGHAMPLRNNAGKIVRWFGTCTDIDEHKRAEEALRDSEQKLHQLASQCLTIREKERKRVSRELHDELGQSLTVLKANLVALENKLSPEQEELKVDCEHLLSFIDVVIDNVRRISWDLSPSSLEDLGLSSSLKHLVQDICENNNMLYSVVINRIDDLFSPETKINIYRIFQESLTNIIRHANATRIDVEIKKQSDPDRVSFLIKDNGKGFDLKKAQSCKLDQHGLGLTTIQERILMAEGTLSISSQAGEGTRILFTLPISPK